MDTSDTDKLFNFPCQFPIKCVGKKEQFQTIVANIITSHIGVIHPSQIKTKISSKDKYLSVTITILASSKPQLDAIYTELNNHPQVLYTL